jgi:hypothetical protein
MKLAPLLCLCLACAQAHSADTIPATSPCTGSFALGGSGGGIVLRGNKDREARECSIRETARVFLALALPQDALAVLCQSAYAKHAPSCQSHETAPPSAPR